MQLASLHLGSYMGVVDTAAHPRINADPVGEILWYARASTSYVGAFDTSMYGKVWRQCAHKRGLREAMCYAWAQSLHQVPKGKNTLTV